MTLQVASFFRSPNVASTRERRLKEMIQAGVPQRSRCRSFGLTVIGTEIVRCLHAAGRPGSVGGFGTGQVGGAYLDRAKPTAELLGPLCNTVYFRVLLQT